MGENKEIKVRLSTVVYLFIIVVLVVALGVVYYFGFVKNDNANNMIANGEVAEKNNIVVNKQENQSEGKNIVIENNIDDKNNVNEMTDEELVEKLFLEEIKERDISNNMERLLDYKVDNIEIITGNKKKEYIDKGAIYKDDILAEVYYSVKPEDVNRSAWDAGNGEIQGDWIVNKFYYVIIRDGKLFSTGTGL